MSDCFAARGEYRTRCSSAGAKAQLSTVCLWWTAHRFLHTEPPSVELTPTAWMSPLGLRYYIMTWPVRALTSVPFISPLDRNTSDYIQWLEQHINSVKAIFSSQTRFLHTANYFWNHNYYNVIIMQPVTAEQSVCTVIILITPPWRTRIYTNILFILSHAFYYRLLDFHCQIRTLVFTFTFIIIVIIIFSPAKLHPLPYRTLWTNHASS